MTRSYVREAILRDGASITIRDLAAADREQLVELFHRMSPESVRHRFFTAKRVLSESDLAYLNELDGVERVALAATMQNGHGERILGTARYVVLPGTTPRAAEVAFDVGDADQGRGIGTLLLEHLAEIARTHDIAAFRAEVEADNAAMLDVFEHSGFVVQETYDDRTFHVEFPIKDAERFVAAAAARERQAAARSLRALFCPASVAVIGASRSDRRAIGRAILDNVIRDGFRGAIYPIHPEAKEIAGRTAYPSVTAATAAAGAPIDLAIVAVPAAIVESVITECAAVGVRGAVVITAGFAETGEAGRAAEQRLRAIVRRAGMRMVGPNCMGILSTDPAVRLDATFSPVFPPSGNVSMVSESGALGLAMLDYAKQLELGIAEFVSIGNRADVSVNDLLSYWHDDPRTKVIALYLESFGNPRAFARLAPEVARQRPIVAVKSGRSAAGTRAASSHSAALASLDVGIDALFAQTGVIRTETIEQLFDVVSLLSSQPVPRGGRIGVVTNAGGPGILLADACEAHGLALPALAPETMTALRAFLPHEASVANPVDMIAAAPPESYERAIELVGNDPNVDAVIAIYVPPLVTEPAQVAAAIARGAGKLPSETPIATVFLSSQGTPATLSGGPRGAIPSYSYPENAALAVSSAVRYGTWRQRPPGTRLSLAPEQVQAVRAKVRAWQERDYERGWVPFDEICELLAIAGIWVAGHRVVADPDAAADAAAALRFPVVLKANVRGLVHKSDQGAVQLGLSSAAAVREAAITIRARLAAKGFAVESFVVQQQIDRGVEALVGMTSDPSLGPLLVTGVGGVAVELYKDVAFRVTPVTDVDVREMLDQLRGRALFDGYRGAPPADRDALRDVILRVAALIEVMPELLELDLNPVIVLPPGQGAVAVDARLRIAARPMHPEAT